MTNYTQYDQDFIIPPNKNCFLAALMQVITEPNYYWVESLQWWYKTQGQ